MLGNPVFHICGITLVHHCHGVGPVVPDTFLKDTSLPIPLTHVHILTHILRPLPQRLWAQLHSEWLSLDRSEDISNSQVPEASLMCSLPGTNPSSPRLFDKGSEGNKLKSSIQSLASE